MAVHARRMSPQDALWLTMDRPNNLMVVDVAVVLDGVVPLADVVAAFAALVERHPVFRRRAERRGRAWLWVDDPEFDLATHVTQVVAPNGSDMATVQRYAAEQRSMPLDRDRPLWTSTVVAPVLLPDGGIGSVIVTRFHHAIADGVRLTQVLLGMLDPQSEVPLVARSASAGGVLLAPSDLADGMVEAARVTLNASRAAVSAVTTAVSHPLDTAGAVTSTAGSGLGVIRHPDRLVDALQMLGAADHRSVNDLASVGKLLLGGSQRTVWTGRPGRAKTVAWSEPLPLARVRAGANRHGATLNDVLVAALAGALRSYLTDRGDVVDEVTWMVPVNLKPFDTDLPEDLGNYFALVMLDLPLTGPTTDRRIADVHHRMERIKNSDEPLLTFGLQRAISMSPAAMATAVTNFFANKAVGVLTNVPGPRTRLLFAGVGVRQVIGFAPCSGDQPLTTTIFTYDDTVTVGFAGDAELVPDPQTLVALVEREIEALGG